MKIIYMLMLTSVIMFAACGDGNTNKSGKPKAIENGPVYVGDENGNGIHYTFKNWKLVSEVPMKDHNAHGTWIEYYPNGEVRLEVEYDMGKKEGKSTEYYDSGEKYVETTYVDNKIHGTRYRYKKDGTLVFEVPYENGKAIPGIKEYDADGKLVEQPTIVFTRKGGNLEMKMSGNASSAEYYQLVEGELLKVPTENGVGKLILGNAKKGQLTIRSIYKTAYGNMAAVDVVY